MVAKLKKSGEFTANALAQWAPNWVRAMVGSMVLLGIGIALTINLLPKGEVLVDAIAAYVRASIQAPVIVTSEHDANLIHLEAEIEALRLEVDRLAKLAHEPTKGK